MTPTEIELPQMILVGLEAETTQAELNATSAALWKRAGESDLDKRIRHLKEPHVTLECQFNWRREGLWTFMLAMEVTSDKDVPGDATLRRVPASKWLVFDLPGTIPNVNVAEGWGEITDWFSANGRVVPLLAYIQRYDEKTKKAQNFIRLEATGT